MKTAYTRWCHFERGLVRVESVVLVGSGLALVLLIFAGVLSRYLLHFSIAWSEELARMLFLWSAFLGAALAIYHDEHGSLNLLGDGVAGGSSGRGRFGIWGLTTVLLALLWGAGLITIANAHQSGQISAALGLPTSWINAGVAVGLGLMLVHSVGRLLRLVVGERSC